MCAGDGSSSGSSRGLSSSESYASSADSECSVQSAKTTTPSLEYYKLVGDNIDKNVQPRDMRSDHQTRSLHYFHTYGVADRVNSTNVSDETQCPDINSVQLQDLLPSVNYDMELMSNFAVLALRVLKKYVPFFSKFGRGVCRHIEHDISSQMSQKSQIVSKV